MEDERQPVDESEFVFRRIHRTYYQSTLPIPVQTAAFRPTERDATGISVFRQRFVEPAMTLEVVDAAKRNEYYVARLSVRELLAVGVSVDPEPLPGGPPGHAVIPELSWSAYHADKRRLKEVQVELARLASADIVSRPGS